MSGYAHPEMLVSTQWASDHLIDPEVRCVEVGFDSDAYDIGHMMGAVFWACNGDILKTGSRDLLDKEAVEALLSRSGIGNKTTIVLYDSHSNLLAAMTLWMLKIYGHQDV